MKRSWQIYNRTHLRTKDKYELKVITDLVCLRSRTLFYSITFFFLSFVCLFFIDSSEIPSVVALLSFDLIRWFIKQSSLKSFKEEVYLAPNINTTGRLLIYSPCLCFLHSDAIVSQVLDELGLNLSDELSSKKKKNPFTFFSLTLWIFSFNAPCLFQACRALAEACRWQEGRRRSLRRPWPTQTQTWRSVWITFGEIERCGEAFNTNILESLCLDSIGSRASGTLVCCSRTRVYDKGVWLSVWGVFSLCVICILSKKKKAKGSLSFIGLANCCLIYDFAKWHKLTLCHSL